jgi:hypothetical protein
VKKPRRGLKGSNVVVENYLVNKIKIFPVCYTACTVKKPWIFRYKLEWCRPPILAQFFIQCAPYRHWLSDDILKGQSQKIFDLLVIL